MQVIQFFNPRDLTEQQVLDSVNQHAFDVRHNDDQTVTFSLTLPCVHTDLESCRGFSALIAIVSFLAQATSNFVRPIAPSLLGPLDAVCAAFIRSVQIAQASYESPKSGTN